MSETDKTLVLADYTLVDTTSADYTKYVAEYPTLANEPVYVLNAVDAAEFEKLNPIMAKAQLVVSGIRATAGRPDQGRSDAERYTGFDLSKLPAGTDLFALLKMPACHPRNDQRQDRFPIRLPGRQNDQPDGGGCGQGRVRRPGDGYRQAADQLHPQHRHPDAAADPALGGLHHRRRVICRPAPPPGWRATCAAMSSSRWRVSPAPSSTNSPPPR